MAFLSSTRGSALEAEIDLKSVGIGLLWALACVGFCGGLFVGELHGIRAFLAMIPCSPLWLPHLKCLLMSWH